ncbi:hypothetical protein JRO89_XS01G0187100 [Xanthoceras sorbifolium]|uniref:Uncharacterized protein n=1 Tax=Xanthoceras sorbifolium TaxID=99658 RepID=A0ABQ8IKG4_9ROSI|nr:hypothetical protein JRO89_XS01G0187100 [Xanthoceras sorbifolium]
MEKHCLVCRRSGVLNERFEALVSLAEEIAKSGIPERSRKIKGKFIQYHLFSLLEGNINTFEVMVNFGTNVLELGRCDTDHTSIITLLHAMKESFTYNNDHSKEDYIVCVQLSWYNERHRCDRMMFEVKHKPYVPLPPEGSTSTNVGHVVKEELETLSWSQLEEFEYEPLEPIGDYDENDLVVSNLSIAEDVEHP